MASAASSTLGLVQRQSYDSRRPFEGGATERNAWANRLLDIVLSVLALVVLAPLMLLIAAAVFLGDHGPVFFGHQRLGRGGSRFRCLKFRTMSVDADRRLADHLRDNPMAREEWRCTRKLSADPRISVVGRFLRKSSLDELPQLFNVLRGDMSLVGPRPIVDEEVPNYGRYISHYYRVRPGITGLWQVSGRSNLSYRRRVAFDVTYCRGASLRMDLRILAATVPAVIMARGAR